MLKPLARLILRMGGWTPVGDKLDVPHAVVIAAPHTSNWDAFWALTFKVLVGMKIRFFAKDTLFWFPLGSLLRAFGAIPLDRSKPGSAVEQAVAAFKDTESFYFGLAPEGTRSYRPGWKYGFYRIATEANVPVALGFLDFKNKRVGFGPTIMMSGDVKADMETLQDFYKDIVGRHPQQASPVKFLGTDAR